MADFNSEPPANQPVPKIYINGYDVANLKYYDTEVISGLKIKWGAEGTTDMPGADQLSMQLVIKKPNDLKWLYNGAVIAVNSFTIKSKEEYSQFVGRIASLSITYSEEQRGMLIVSISAVGMVADLANVITYDVSAAQVQGSTKLGHLSYYTPAGWGLSVAQSTVHWPDQWHAAVRYKSKKYLEMLDQFLRAQNMYRTDSSYYLPSTGVVQRLMLHELLNRRVIVRDGLRVDNDGTWHPNPSAPKPAAPDLIAGSPFYNVLEADASYFREDTEWSMEPDDLVTELSVQRIDDVSGYEGDATRTPINSRTYFNTEQAVQAFGIRNKEVDTDLNAGSPVDTYQMEVMYAHLNVVPAWRLYKLRFADTTMLGDWFVQLTATHRRYSVLLAVKGLQDNRPDNEYTLQRGMIVGGEMTWLAGDKKTGKPGKWDLTVNISDYQIATELSNAGNWTLETIRNIPVPAISQATFSSVGKDITIADFRRI